MREDDYIRRVDRPLEASKLMQRMFDTPLAVHPARVPILVSAMSGKYGLQSITMDGATLDAGGMQQLQQNAKIEALAGDAKRREGRIFDEDDGVAVIQVWGTLVKSWGLDPWSGMTGYDGIEAKYLAAMEDRNVRAIWLDIESGGGDVSGLFDLVDLMWELNQANGGEKPVYAFLNDYGYSAAYAIASAADKIFMPRTGGAGSVGVITVHATRARQYEAQGVDVTVIRGGEQKARANPFEILPEETRAHIQRQVDSTRELFVKTVARNRRSAMSEKTVRETEGLDYMGEEARALGLVSGICTERDAWGKLQRKINR